MAGLWLFIYVFFLQGTKDLLRTKTRFRYLLLWITLALVVEIFLQFSHLQIRQFSNFAIIFALLLPLVASGGVLYFKKLTIIFFWTFLTITIFHLFYSLILGETGIFFSKLWNSCKYSRAWVYHFDALTGAYSRGIISQINFSSRDYLMMGDINGFKKYNDLYSHTAGDYLLQSMVKNLQSSIRHNDYVIRMGGDAFLVVLKNCTGYEMEKAIEQIKNSFLTDENNSGVTMSWGEAVAGDNFEPKFNLK